MAAQIVLITGCSSGIGMAAAVLLAKQKQQFKVYATMRNLGSKVDLETAAGDTLNKTLFIRELDVTKETTIASVVGEILRENGRIDVLVNNAGTYGVDAIDQRTLEWCKAMMDTNYWGVVRCTRAVLPAMKKQQSGRILNVSSFSGVVGIPFYATYASTKFAVEGFSESIAAILRDGYNIRVIIVEPGPVKTAALADALADPEVVANDFEDILKGLYVRSAKKNKDKLLPMTQSVDEIAQQFLEIILSEKPHLRYQTSDLIRQNAGVKLRDTTTDALLEMLKH